MSKNKYEITIGGWACQALGIVFVTLKLMHYIDWSWWWVTAPFWGPFAIAVGLLLLFAIIRGILSMFFKY
jgi:hypothetical protein